VGAPIDVTREQVLAYRVAAHNLGKNLPSRRLQEAAGVWAVPDMPHGNAGLALTQRVMTLDRAGYERALYDDRTLVAGYSIRSAMHVFPAPDFGVFTIGARPDGDDSIATSVLSYSENIAAAGLTPTAALELVADRMVAAIGTGTPTKGEVSTALTSMLPDALTPYCKGCGVPHVGDGLFRMAALMGALCFAGPRGTTITLVQVKNWLGAVRLPEFTAARTELVRRFTHCFGPTSPDLFASALMISSKDATKWWSRMARELVEVRVEGKRAWIREEDVARLRRPRQAKGVRLLPPNDPFLQLRDRQIVAPDASLRKRMWRPAGNPGLVLVEGRPVAIWRSEAKKSTLVAKLEPIERLSKATLNDVSAAAARLAPWRGCDDAEAVVMA
jgi:hypothetical protein